MSTASTEEFSGPHLASSSEDSEDLSFTELMARTALQRQNAVLSQELFLGKLNFPTTFLTSLRDRFTKRHCRFRSIKRH